MSTSDMMRTVESIDNRIKISLKMTLPKMDAISLDIRLESLEKGVQFFEWSYQKKHGEKKLSELSVRGQRVGLSPPGFQLENDNYIMEWQKEYNESDVGGVIAFRVNFKSDQVSSGKNDSFLMRI